MLAALLRICLCASCFTCAFFATKLILTHLHMMTLNRQSINLDDILRDRTLCLLLFGAATLVLAYGISPWLLLPGIPCCWILSAKAPKLLDAHDAKKMRRLCDEHVDTMADIVSMGIQSGLSFDAALELYCSKFDNMLSSQLQKASIEWKSGLATRQEALFNLSESVRSKALKRFADTSLQAIQHGSPLADTLKRFSSDIRQRKRNAIERQIARAPVKMLIPTGTCILPAMLILIMGPMLLQFMQTNI